jgi:hypothetical protein
MKTGGQVDIFCICLLYLQHHKYYNNFVYNLAELMLDVVLAE